MAQGPHRREPRRFEPPPWEREQFEEIERERAEQERRAREEAQAARAARANAAAEAQSADGESAARESSGAPTGADVDAMLMALRAEEPPAVSEAWRFGFIVAVFVGTIGVMLVIWGMVALARSAGGGPAGIMGALIMSVMGGLFVGLAAWMGARSLKQRGVL